MLGDAPALALAATVAQGSGGSVPGDPTGGLLSYGVLGLLVIAFLTGQIVPGILYKRTEKENDRLRALIDEKVYPMVEASTSASREAQVTMREVIKALAETEDRDPRPRPRRRVE